MSASTSGGPTDRVGPEYDSSGETKPGVQTSEFILSIIVAINVLVAAAVADEFSAEEAWRLITYLSIGYVISRGLAKLGVGRNHH
jgi:hypothetical protein